MFWLGGNPWKAEAERAIAETSHLRTQLAWVQGLYVRERQESRELTEQLRLALTPKAEQPNPGWQPTEADEIDPEIEDAINQRAARGTLDYSNLVAHATMRQRQRWGKAKIVEEILRGAQVDDDMILAED